MPLYKSWNDFDALRDKNKILVIYGAGINGHRFLDYHKIVPDYFCDKNARRIKSVRCRWGEQCYKCLTLKDLIKKLNGRDADILVSNLDEKVIEELHKIFAGMNFTESTVIYFRYDYDIPSKRFIKAANDIYKINNIINGVFRFARNLDYIKENFDISVLVKNAYFKGNFQSVDEFEKFIKSRIINKLVFKNGRIKQEVYDSSNSKSFKNISYAQYVYFFCDSRFLSAVCKTEYSIEYMLQQFLNYKNTEYEIQNYSVGGFIDKQVIFQLTNAPLAKNSVVIIISELNTHQFLIAKRYCQIYNCRLIYYYIPLYGIIHKKNLTDYEIYPKKQ